VNVVFVVIVLGGNKVTPYFVGFTQLCFYLRMFFAS